MILNPSHIDLSPSCSVAGCASYAATSAGADMRAAGGMPVRERAAGTWMDWQYKDRVAARFAHRVHEIDTKEQEAGGIAVTVIDGMNLKPHTGPAAGHEDPGG